MVGLWAARCLHKLGFEVHGVSGKVDQVKEALSAAGVSELIDRETWLQRADAALLRPVYDGGIDCTGGLPLVQMLKQMKSYSAVATCGVAAGSDFNTTIFPFILRGCRCWVAPVSLSARPALSMLAAACRVVIC